MTIDEIDFPTVGLTDFDLWMTKLYLHMFKEKFLEIVDYGTLDREHWRQYYDCDMTPEQAFAEDLTCYGE